MLTRFTLGVLGLLAGLFLVLDFYEVITGTVDLNRHVPFLYPVVLTIFAGLVVWMDRLSEKVSVQRSKSQS